MWNEATPWVAARAAGMLQRAIVATSSCPQQGEGWVDFRTPSVEIGAAYAQSSEQSMRFRVDELGDLEEGDEVVIEHVKDSPDSRVKYKVQSPPMIPPNGTGFEKIAFLTTVEPLP